MEDSVAAELGGNSAPHSHLSYMIFPLGHAEGVLSISCQLEANEKLVLRSDFLFTYPVGKVYMGLTF